MSDNQNIYPILSKEEYDFLSEGFPTSKNPKDVQIAGDHYKTFAIQPYEYCYKNNLNNLQSEAISYISRYNRKWKDDLTKQIEDLNKAKHTIDLLISELTKNES